MSKALDPASAGSYALGTTSTGRRRSNAPAPDTRR